MRKSIALLSMAALVTSSACTTRGGGRAGIVLFDPDQHVSGAEPLFGTDEFRCFRDPTYGLSFVMPVHPTTSYPLTCQQITRSVRTALGSQSGESGQISYTLEQRNEVIESFMSSSNNICADHMKFLQQYDGNINSILGIGTQASAGLAVIITGGAAQAAAAMAAFLGGARGTMNNAHFNNKTVGVLVAAFQAERKKQRDEITKMEAKAVKDYPLSQGVQNVLDYHGSCSIVVGLAAAQRAVDESSNPNLESVKTFLTKLEEVRTQMAKFVNEPAASNAKK